MFTQERLEELVQFIKFEKDLFKSSCCSSIDEGSEDADYEQETLNNFDDTLEVIRSLIS